MRFLILLSIFGLFVSSTWCEIQFEEVSQQAGFTRIGESWGNAWGDFDGDGYLDLWATNHRHKPSLYRNNRDGTFTDIIDEVWRANPYADTHGAAWADFDNDGDQDLIVLSGSGGGLSNRIDRNHANHFYVNENGMLIERAAKLGVDYPLLRGRTPLWLDWNRDGQLDILLTGIARTDRNGTLLASTLFGQTMNGFKNVNTDAGFHLEQSAALAQYADLTSDGNMEIIVSYHRYPLAIYDASGSTCLTCDSGDEAPSLAIYDTSGSTLRDLMETFRIAEGTAVQDAVIADFNGDLQPDIFLTRGNYQSYVGQIANHQLELNIRNNPNEKGISFKTEGDVSFQIYSEWSPQPSLVNIGTDGHPVTAFDDAEFRGITPNLRSATFKVTLSPNDPRVIGLKPRAENTQLGIYVGYQPDTKRWTLLYRKLPSISRVEATQPISEIETLNFSWTDLRKQPTSQLLVHQKNGFPNAETVGIFNTFEDGRCVTAGDFDNDMDLDLYIVRSSTAANLPNHLYENLGNGSFIQSLDAGGAIGSSQGRGQSVTTADYDRDGYLDIFVTNGRGEYPFSEGPDQLFRNIGGNNNWLQIDLEGTISNRDGIGARLFATTPDGKIQLRENGGGIHWCQQDQKRIHFGLAQNEKIDELTIYWPSGIVQTLKNVPANQVLHVVEFQGKRSLSADVNEDGRVDLLDLVFVAKHINENPPTDERADTNSDGKVDIEDMIWIIKAVEAKLTTAAPSNTAFSETDFAILSALYEKIETTSANPIQIESVKRFLRQLLMPIERPIETKLHANYPNPFNPETWIPYQLAEDTEITIRIYNASGQVVRTLFTGNRAAGYYLSRSKAAYWDGRNELGEPVASGVYFYELATPTFKQTKQLVVLK
ncbi:hypothetical protein C6496_10795 [Candidatus Poribacteria bacterium]|nr:MAG: hypothetical protein C6496_10795 [Candidatus Poribacteria bacterium]